MKRIVGSSVAAVLAAIALQPAPTLAEPPKAAIGAWGIDTAGMSKTVRPGDDFYRYVNERWLKTAKIPQGLPATDALTELYLSTEQRVLEIIKEAREGNDAPGTPEQLIADYYRSFADRDRRNALGLTPIAAGLGMLMEADTHSDLARAMGFTWTAGVVSAGIESDPDDPRRQIPSVVQSGLTLPSRDYYLQPGEPYEGFRAALRDYIASTFRRAGVPDADARADKVFALETEMARRQWTRAEMRDVVRQNRVMTLAELEAWAPGFDWRAFLGEIGYDKQPRIKVKSDTAVRDIARLFAETPVADLQSYMLFHALDDWSNSLSDEWVEAYFDFHLRKLMGVVERRPFELEAVGAVNGMFGEEIGRIYVEEYFPAAHRAEVNTMVGYLRDMFRERITKLDWMDAPTKAAAIAKLEKVVSHIGYPERWHDRSGIRIDRADLLGNQMRILDWNRADRLKQLAEGTRDWEFPFNPQEVNAGYIAALNSVTFPAGILQPPYFDPAADPAVNFGAVVAVIGHEFGHGFDDQGSRSDGDGRVRDWWSAASRAEFEKRTAGLVEQFSQYEPVPGARINGRQNLGENIGDLGGLSIAYAAYRRYVDEKQGGKAPVIDGFTGDQRFFLSWAQVWRSLVTESEERRRLLSDPHSPGEFRVNGIVRNVDAWYQAFDVKPGDKLYLPPEARVRIW
jgi:endothelin-converting enzyme/putative endopeptidase